MLLIFLKMPDIYVSIGVYLKTMTIFHIILEISLINFSFVIDKDSLAIPHISCNSSKIYLIRIFNQSDVINFFIYYSFDIDIRIREWNIFDEEIAKLFLIFIK
jgi:hypothetical protein